MSAAGSTAKRIREWGELQRNGELIAAANHLDRLERDNAELLAVCKAAHEIIDVFLADQSGAKDPRCGLVQPVTVGDCNALGRVYNLLGIKIAKVESEAR